MLLLIHFLSFFLVIRSLTSKYECASPNGAVLEEKLAPGGQNSLFEGLTQKPPHPKKYIENVQ
jgi:hypothetical protein